MATTKVELRSQAKDVRRTYVASLTAPERCAAAVLLAEIVITHLDDAETVAAYLPIGSEIDTLPLLDRLAALNCRIALPRVSGLRGTLRFLEWSPGDVLEGGPMGLRQPPSRAPEVVPDLILTPLLAFDSALHRLGYGAGHYDRAFATLTQARRVGLAWHAQRVDALAIDSWDVAMHAVATERDWIEG